MTKEIKESIEITYEITFKGNIEKINPKKLAQKLSGVTKKYLKDSGHHIDMKAFDVKYYTTDDIPVGKLDKLDELEKEILLKVAGANQERVARLEEVGARQMYYILGLIILVILLSISKLEMLF